MQESLLSHIASNFIKEYENVANSSVSYLLNKYPVSREVLRKYLNINDIPNFYETEYSTEYGRLDIAGKDINGKLSLIIEGKFWASLTDNQPVNYLKNLDDNGVLLFLAPERRIESLKLEIQSRTGKVDSKIHYISWNHLLNLIEQENKKEFNYSLESDLVQLRELCAKMDEEGMPPLSDSDLSPMNGRINYQFANLINDCNKLLRQQDEFDFNRMKSQPTQDGYGFYFKAYGFGCNLCFSSEDWFMKPSHTPFWLYIVDEEFNEDKRIYHYLKDYDEDNSYNDYASLGIVLETGWDKKQIVSHITEKTKHVLEYLNSKMNK